MKMAAQVKMTMYFRVPTPLALACALLRQETIARTQVPKDAAAIRDGCSKMMSEFVRIVFFEDVQCQ